jgi:hypothetical protein
VALLSLRGALAELRHVDHHAHALVRAGPGDLDAFRGLFSESPDPAQWPHVATTVMYQRAIAMLAQHLGCAPDEGAVFAARRDAGVESYARELMTAAGAEALLVDEGYPPADEALSALEMGELAGCRAHPVLRIESVCDADLGERIATARAGGTAALKTVLAYRGGLDLDMTATAARDRLLTALAINRDTGDPLPVQVHTGFGDPDLLLARSDPSLLKPLFERFPETPFVLLHCYPFHRAAGWLASVYANVFFDLSLTIPHVARPAAVLAEAIELAPLSKLLYASDAVRTPELYLLAAVWWRDALAEVLGPLLGDDAALAAARLVLRDNADGLYRLGLS